MATTIPQVPNYTGEIALRSAPENFSQNAEDQYTYLAQFSVDLNNTVEATNASALEIEAAESSSIVAKEASESAALISESNANFDGLWAGKSGAANVPYSVYHNGQSWQLLIDIADISASEPSDINTDWNLLINGSDVATNSNNIAINASNILLNTNDIETNTANIVQENYLKPNQNLNVPYGDAVLPNAIAEDYTAGEVFAYDYEAVTNIVGLARVGGVTSGTSGTYMRSYKGDFSNSFFGVQLADDTVSQVGVDIDYNVRKAGYTTVAVDIASSPDHYCVVLSPAEGRVAIVNDEESIDTFTKTKMALNAGGDAPIYAVRAWGSVSGTGTVTLLDGGNIAALADFQTGKVRVSMLKPMSNVNYSVVTSGSRGSSITADGVVGHLVINKSEFWLVSSNGAGSFEDFHNISFSVMGN